MKERDHCTPGICPGATAKGETVSIYMARNQRIGNLKHFVRRRRGSAPPGAPSPTCQQASLQGGELPP